jgi:ubiquinone/menaquinone biosynthesis C-methylase UbiE
MLTPSNQANAVVEHYKTSAHLDARIRLHDLYTVAPHDWSLWIVDQMALPAAAQILEIGCGTGKLWQQNLHRLSAGWTITLSDQSAGMLQQAQAALASSAHPFHFEQFDTQTIPFAAATFDAVVANHMLYHVPDLPKALGEINRVLKPGGRLYAATNGQHHMKEMLDLVQTFTQQAASPEPRLTFTLENGAAWLAPHFAQVEVRRYESALHVTAAEPLVAYVLSMQQIEPAQAAAFTALVEQALAKHNGLYSIQKDTGLFVAHQTESIS